MEGNAGSAGDVYMTPWVVFCLISSDDCFYVRLRQGVPIDSFQF